jgi:hypothetical protein
LAFLAACGGGGKDVPVTGLTFNAEPKFVQMGKQMTISAAVQPSNASNKAVTWQSSNPAVASVSNGSNGTGSVSGLAEGSATVTATAQDGGISASCTVTVTKYDPVEEAARKREFDRLSGPVNVNKTVYQIANWEDFSKPMNWMYASSNHTVYGYGFAVSSNVTDSILKGELERNVNQLNTACLYSWEHELKHGSNAKYVRTIKDPKKIWKACYLDEASAYLASMVLFRINMLEEYSKQLNEWVLAGKNPNQFKFNVSSYFMEVMGGVPDDSQSRMLTWYDTNNNLTELKSLVSQNEALLLVNFGFERFAGMFDVNYMNYRDSINRAFGEFPNFISVSYDTDEFFQTAVNAWFTYEINGKTVNLFELMGSAARAEFLSKLNAKMELEYQRYTSGYYN